MPSLSDRRLRSLADATSSVLFTANPDGRVIEPQPSWERFTGQRWPTYRGHGWLDAVHAGTPIDLAAATEATEAADPGIAGEAVAQPVLARVWHHESRSFRHVKGQAIPMQDTRGRLVEWVVSLEDVHEHLMAQRRLQEVASRLEMVLANAPVGLGLFDADLRVLLLNDALANAVGVDAREARGHPLAAVSPALDRHLASRLREVARTGEPAHGPELRGVVLGAEAGSGRRDWLVSCYGIPRVGGEPVDVGVALVDVTERNALQHLVHEVSEREAQDRFRLALDAMLDLVMILRAVRDDRGRIVDFRVEHANRQRPDVAGRWAGDLVGRTMSELYPAFAGSRLFDGYVHVVETREPLNLDEIEYQDDIGGRPVQAVFAMQITAFEDGVISVSRDVSERRRRRLELERAFEQLAAAQRLAQIGIWEIDLATRRFTFSDELQRILGLSVDATSEDLDTAISRYVHPDHHDLVRSLVEHTPTTGQPFTADAKLVRGDREHRVVTLYGTVAYDDAGEPVRLWGTMQDVTEHRAADEKLRAAAVRLERERAVVTNLQQALLPGAPSVPGLDLAVRYLPAGYEARVGGDWYDVIRLDARRVLLAVGDVAGHGLAAAALMAQLRNALRGAAFAGQESDAILATLNAMLAQTAPDEMATASCGLYDTETGEFCWACAGHPPPVLHPAGDGGGGRPPALLLELPCGPPLGMPDARYPLHRVQVPPGATLVLYTDGLVEERGRPIDDGLVELLGIVSANGDQSVSEVCDAVTNGLFSRRERRDDVCLLIARPIEETSERGRAVEC